MTSGLEAPLSRAVAAAARFVADSGRENTSLFDESLVVLIRSLNGVENTARLSINSHLVSELLNYCPLILSASTTNASTRSKLHRMLFNIGFYNVPLRRYLSGHLEMCGPVFFCMKQSLKEQLGPQNLIDILRLMQVLTYEKCLTLGLWTNELISFLMSEVNREDEMEWMPYCIAILCNLASRSKSVCTRIKKSSSYKIFSRRIMKLLSHDSRIVVVSSLVLIGYLEEKVRDMVFCTENIHETFQCVFNVLTMGDGDCLMTRQIAADLLKRLVVSEAPTVSSIPVITTTGKDVMNYSFFPRCIQQTAELLVQLDPRLEETTKVYDLFLSFCSLPQLRGPVCTAIISCTPNETRLTTPMHSILTTAATTLDEATDPTTPLKALRLLTYLFKECADMGEHIGRLLPTRLILSVVDSTLKTSVDTAREDAVYQCQRITEGLRLAEACSQDEELRVGLLEVATDALCSHTGEFQLMTNPIVHQMGKPPTQRTDKLPNWSIYGVAIVLELIRLLASLKDFSKLHKVQYWKSLKDERLVPFMAYAIAYGDHEMVYDALLLYTHCAQVQAFPSRWLGDLVASCAIAKRHNQDMTSSTGSMNNSKDSNKDTCEPMDISRGPDPRENSKIVDDLLKRLKGGMEVKDVKMSEMLSAYEKKISLMERRERDLEGLLSAKDQALAQSERMRLQFKNGTSTSEADMARIRQLVADNETLKENLDKQNVVLEVTRKTLEEKAESLREELVRVRQDRDELASEIGQERHLVASVRKHADDLKSKLEIASNTLQERQSELIAVSTERNGLMSTLAKMKIDVQNLQNDNSRLSVDTEQKRRLIEGINLEMDSIKGRLTDKELECQKYYDELLKLRSRGEKTEADLDRMKKLREEMMKLAGEYQ